MDGAVQARAQRVGAWRGGGRDGPKAAGRGPGKLNSWIPSRARAKGSREACSPAPPVSHLRRGPDTHQTVGTGSCLLQGLSRRGGGDMKGCCPNCNRQPISNALAASTSEPASHGSRLGKAWADGCLPGPMGGSPWLPEPGTAKILEEQNQSQL